MVDLKVAFIHNINHILIDHNMLWFMHPDSFPDNGEKSSPKADPPNYYNVAISIQLLTFHSILDRGKQ